MVKRWLPPPIHDETQVKQLGKDLNIGSDLASILITRGVDTYEKAKAFFRAERSQLHDPFLMDDMAKAIDRMDVALAKGEKIMVYGDYDVDGTSAVALVYSFLKKRHEATEFYVPDRYLEGYGISVLGIEYAKTEGITLIIALDCGIKANDKVDLANSYGIDFIICDHHLPGAELPAAHAILNPKKPGCSYPFKELPGCGIGFKLAQAWCQRHEFPFSELEEYLDLVAVAISADIVPMVGENRVLTTEGLKKMKVNPNPGFKCLMEVFYDKPFYEVNDLVFSVGPRINAAGRMAHGKEAVELMIAKTEEEAKEKAIIINERNALRKDVDRNTTIEAMLETADLDLDKKTTVLFNPEWHKGVLGIVASRLIEKYHRPTIVLCESNGMATGSARSVAGFDLHDALDKCSDLLEQWGGHMFAAGMILKKENVPLLQVRFEEIVASRITLEQLTPPVAYDAEIPIARITAKYMSIIRQMAPFGPQNMNPVFRSNDVWDTGYARLAGAGHLQLSLVQDDRSRGLRCIAFGLGEHYDRISAGESFDICYTIEENYWEGKMNLQLNIKDIQWRR